MNHIYKKFLVLTGYTDHQVLDALHAAGHDISRNMVRSWALGEGARNYRPMTEGDLNAVLDSLILQLPPKVGTAR